MRVASDKENMQSFMRRYILKYAVTLLVLGSLWCSTVYLLEGLVPIVCGCIFFAVMFFTYPLLAYRNYLQVKKIVCNYKKCHIGPIHFHTLYADLNKTVSEQLGITVYKSIRLITKVLKNNFPNMLSK